MFCFSAHQVVVADFEERKRPPGRDGHAGIRPRKPSNTAMKFALCYAPVLLCSISKILAICDLFSGK